MTDATIIEKKPTTIHPYKRTSGPPVFNPNSNYKNKEGIMAALVKHSITLIDGLITLLSSYL
jgi:hypothetical protein